MGYVRLLRSINSYTKFYKLNWDSIGEFTFLASWDSHDYKKNPDSFHKFLKKEEDAANEWLRETQNLQLLDAALHRNFVCRQSMKLADILELEARRRCYW
jgi:hypothetical protein